MNQARQLGLIEEMDKDMLEILKKKGADYVDKDVLSNFKRVSLAVKALNIDVTTPTGYALFMVILKIDRITNLLKDNKIPKNESLDDSFKDGVNYLKLAYLCNKEKADNNKMWSGDKNEDIIGDMPQINRPDGATGPPNKGFNFGEKY